MKTNLRLIGGKRIQSPNNIYTRPTTLRVREAIFNILSDKVENSNWLDLFSGTGAISCEAYNHGAKKIIAIPAMLFAAGHVKNDIPSLLMNYSSKTGMEIV